MSFKIGGGSADGTTFNFSIASGGVTENVAGNLKAVQSASIQVTRTNIQVAPEIIAFRATVSGFSVSETTQPAYNPTVSGLQYKWSFDDAGSQHRPSQLPTGLRDANTAYGKEVAHLFASPGTYTVSCTVTEPSTGSTATSTIDITVAATISAFAASDITYIDPDSNFTNAPANANEYTSISTFMSKLQAGNYTTPQLVYLSKGKTHNLSNQSFNGSAQIPSVYIMADPIGGGADPVVQAAAGGITMCALLDMDPAQTADFCFNGITFQGLWDATTETGTSKRGFTTGDADVPSRFQLSECTFTGFSTAFEIGDRINLAMANCTVTNWRSFGMLANSMGDPIIIIGSDWDHGDNILAGGPKTGDFNDHGPLRFFGSKSLIMCGNRFSVKAGWFQNVVGYQTLQPTLRLFTGGGDSGLSHGSYANLQANIYENGATVVDFGPTNIGEEGAGLSATFERNIVVSNFFSGEMLKTAHGGVTARNNLFIRPNVEQIRSDFTVRHWFRAVDPLDDVSNASDYPIRFEGNTMINLCTDANDPTGAAAVTESSIDTAYASSTVQANFIHEPNLDTPNTPYTNIDSTALFTPTYDAYRSRYQRYSSTFETENGSSVANGASFKIAYTNINTSLTQAKIGTETPNTGSGSLLHELSLGSNVHGTNANVSFAFGASDVTITNNTGGTLTGAFTVHILTDDDALINVETDLGTPTDSVWSGKPLVGSTNTGVATGLAGWDDFYGVTRGAPHSVGAVEVE